MAAWSCLKVVIDAVKGPTGVGVPPVPGEGSTGVMATVSEVADGDTEGEVEGVAVVDLVLLFGVAFISEPTSCF